MTRSKNTVLLLGRKNSGTRNWGLKYIATPPGETIKEQLDDKGLSLKDFADKMDMPEESIKALISGDMRLTPEIAVKLEKALGIPAEFWNNLEAIYRKKIMKAEVENKAGREDSTLIRKVGMDCPLCDKIHEVEERKRLTTDLIEGEKITYEERFYRCTNSDDEENEFATGSMVDENLSSARRAYRAKHGL